MEGWIARIEAVTAEERNFKCHDCLHLRKGFDDGVMCGYGTREVFKTPANIRMCGDWTPAARR